MRLNENDPTKLVLQRHGITINIEWPLGDLRQYRNSDYRRTMRAHYGYIRGTMTEEDDMELDCYVGSVPNDVVYKITQMDYRDPSVFDEYKYLIDFRDAAEAKEIFILTTQIQCFGGIEELTIDEFKEEIKRVFNSTTIDVNKVVNEQTLRLAGLRY